MFTADFFILVYIKLIVHYWLFILRSKNTYLKEEMFENLIINRIN